MSFLSSLPSNIQLNDETASSWVTLTRTGTWNHPVYKQFSITQQMLREMVNNFEQGTYGQKIFIDVGHNPDGGNAGEIVQLSIEGNRLRARIEWTPWGRKQVTEKGYRYFSVDFHDNWKDPETEIEHGPVLFGAALTTRPFVKRLDPVELSEEFTPPDRRVFMHQELRRQLSEFVETTMNKFLKKLRERLEARKLSKGVIDQLVGAAEQSMKALGEDEKALSALVDKFDETGKTLAESVGDQDVKLSIDLTGVEPKADKAEKGEGGNANGAQLSEDKVGEIVAKQLAEVQRKADEQQKKLAENLDARKKILSEVIDAAEGIDDDQKKALCEEVEDLITPDMPEDKVRKLAEHQVSQAHKVASARKLADLGYQDSRSGSPHIAVEDQNTVKKLSDCIRDNLRKTSVAQFGGLRLPEKDSPFVARVLSEFDRHHAAAYDREHKVLAGETSWDGNTNLPVGFKREVIREALSDLNILSLLQQIPAFTANTTVQIPYEERDGSAIVNDGIVHEGQGIPSAGISQKMDNAYVTAMKLAMKLTNEVMFFTRASQMDWDAFARNVQSNARFIRELLQKRVANELQRSADAYNAVDVTGEDIAPQLDGSTSTIKSAEFPIVRPRQVRDIAGNAVGNEENPIAIDFNGTAIEAYDGTGNQSAGTYYRVTDYNLGYIQFVDESGSPVTPTQATATIGYSYATNILKWDSDVPSGTTVAEHYDGLLRAIGSRKAVLNGERQTMPDFSLMSPVLEDEVTNAKGFVPITNRPGASADDATGDLQRVKGLPAFTTNAPNLDMGDGRIVIGQRGVGAYAIVKPWEVGQPFEAVNSQGQPTGEKVAYGEEYNAVHVPSAVRDRLTSVIVYSATNR